MTKTLKALFALAALTAPAAAMADEWMTSVKRIIASRQTYPRSAQLRGEEGTTRLLINLSSNGHIDHVTVAQSSGSAILDREAQQVVTRIGKLPAPPAGARALTVPIVWRLN